MLGGSWTGESARPRQTIGELVVDLLTQQRRRSATDEPTRIAENLGQMKPAVTPRSAQGSRPVG